MATADFNQAKDLAIEYGDKKVIGRMAAMGMVEPTTAVLAGMMLDRIAANAIKPPEKTVTEEVFGPPQAGLGAIAPQGMGQPQMAQAPQQGLDQIPVPEQMFSRPQGAAAGGIVAFSSGNLVRNPKDKTAAYFQSLQDFNPSEFRGVRGAELSSMMRDTRGLKVDPVTGNPISLGEFIRAVDSGKIQIPEDFSVTPKDPSFAQALQTNPTPPQIALPGVDDSAEMAKFARQTTGVPLSSSGLEAASQQPPPPGPQPGPAADVSAVPGLREQLMSRLQSAYQITPEGTPAGIPAGTDIKSLMAERAQAEQLAGVDKDFFKNEARNIVAQRDELKGDKREAANMRLIEAGLRIMGGDSPYAFVNIGKGASEALKGFADDVKDIQKTKREYDKAERELRTAEQLYARNKSDETLKEVQRRRERAEDRNASFQKSLMQVDLQLAELGVKEAQLRVQQRAADKAPAEIQLIERYSKDPRFAEAFRNIQAARQEPKTRAALEKEFLDNPVMVSRYGTYDNYLRNTQGAGTNYREKYGLE